MKTTLTIEQSARLIELGVDPKLASKTIVTDEYNEQWENFQHPIFGLIDILSILPKRIDTDEDVHPIVMSIDEEADVCYVSYMGFSKTQFAPELIDALYQLLIWCLEQGYCKCGEGGGR